MGSFMDPTFVMGCNKNKKLEKFDKTQFLKYWVLMALLMMYFACLKTKKIQTDLLNFVLTASLWKVSNGKRSQAFFILLGDLWCKKEFSFWR